MTKALFVLVLTFVLALGQPVQAWRGGCRGDYWHRCYDPYDGGYGDSYGYNGRRHRFYDPHYGGYGGYGDDYYGYGGYPNERRYFGDRPLQFRFRSPDFEFDIRD